MGGLIYDLMGRFKTIAFMLFFGGVSTILIPIVSPSLIGFTIPRVVLQCTIVPVLMNPLINDYVKVRSRGVAMGMQQQGVTLGNIISIAGLYTATSIISPYYGFTICAMVLFLGIAGIYFFDMVQEPTVLNVKEAKR
jgi:MFS family permease